VGQWARFTGTATDGGSGPLNHNDFHGEVKLELLAAYLATPKPKADTGSRSSVRNPSAPRILKKRWRSTSRSAMLALMRYGSCSDDR
jgi:hypothetical protein